MSRPWSVLLIVLCVVWVVAQVDDASRRGSGQVAAAPWEVEARPLWRARAEGGW